MDAAAFDRMKSKIMRSFPPSGGHDLLGMEIDFNAYLYRLDVLDNAYARLTDDPERLIVATATGTPGVSADKVATALEEVWSTSLRYNYREAQVITSDPESVRLTAITQIAPDGFYFSAEVTVRPAH